MFGLVLGLFFGFGSRLRFGLGFFCVRVSVCFGVRVRDWFRNRVCD